MTIKYNVVNFSDIGKNGSHRMDAHYYMKEYMDNLKAIGHAAKDKGYEIKKLSSLALIETRYAQRDKISYYVGLADIEPATGLILRYKTFADKIAEDGPFDSTEMKRMLPVANAGDLLVSITRECGIAAMVEKDGSTYSSEFACLKPKHISGEVLLSFLLSPFGHLQLEQSDLQSGSSYKISQADLGMISVLVPDQQRQDEISQLLKTKRTELQQTIVDLAEKTAKAKESFSEGLGEVFSK